MNCDRLISCGAVMLAMVLLWAAGPAFGAFIPVSGSPADGVVERFSGTTLDLSAFRASLGDVVATQNNGLYLSGADAHAGSELTTRTISVPVGGYAELSARATAQNSDNLYTQLIFAGLATDDSPSQIPELGSTYAFTAAYFNSNFNKFAAIVGSSGSGNSFNIATPALPALDLNYILRLDRLSATSIRFSVLDENHTELGSLTRSTANTVSGPMKVFLGTGASTRCSTA